MIMMRIKMMLPAGGGGDDECLMFLMTKIIIEMCDHNKTILSFSFPSDGKPQPDEIKFSMRHSPDGKFTYTQPKYDVCYFSLII